MEKVLIICETYEKRKEIAERLDSYSLTLPYFSKISQALDQFPKESKVYFLITCLSDFAANGKYGTVYTLTPFCTNSVSLHEITLGEEISTIVEATVIVKAEILIEEKSHVINVHRNYILNLKLTDDFSVHQNEML